MVELSCFFMKLVGVRLGLSWRGGAGEGGGFVRRKRTSDAQIRQCYVVSAEKITAGVKIRWGRLAGGGEEVSCPGLCVVHSGVGRGGPGVRISSGAQTSESANEVDRRRWGFERGGGREGGETPNFQRTPRE